MRARGVCLVVGVIAVALAAAIASCAGSRHAPSAADQQPAPYRFPHGAQPHAALGCAACHDPKAVLSGQLARPGANDHAPCDRSGCHADAFLDAPGKLCTLCHTVTVPQRQGGTVAAPYPPLAGARALASEFSHATHLDKARMDAAVGFHASCGDCHARAGTAEDPDLPGHAACLRCHGAEAARPAKPPITGCSDCHRARAQDPPRGRRVITGDLHFHHANHEQDRAGHDIRCADCHRDIGKLAKISTPSTPATAVCVGCHDDSKRAPRKVSMGNCETCHATKLGGRFASVVAPRSHLAGRELPDDHTLAFRKDHATEARRDGVRCAGCHRFMSGSTRENCDECHQTMRPHDHTLSWPEMEHGQDAAVQPERCALCHDGEFCTACHARPPRSHFPLSEFQLGAVHAPLGRADTRACFTCHNPGEASCLASGCHVAGGVAP